ncbi:hypothetical protein [Paraburkholderia sp. BL10I2N1]|uniref:hypothetical protein n=1 Tax=Paraburkholderia sp. BL10I2N1 TaxID=1938796 RepID=UPI00105E8011|nr:hypothetical protein [Paraburkholderia sp. BL10I2N1]
MSRMVGMTIGAALAGVFDIYGPHGASVALFFGGISSALGVVAGAVRMTGNSGARKMYTSILEYRTKS